MTATRRPSGSSSRRTPRRTSSAGRSYPRRRRTRSVSSTVGAAIGTVLVGALLDLPWPVKVGLVLLVVLVGVGYIVWSHRAEIAAGARADQADAPAAAPDPPDQSPPPGGPPA